MEFIYVSADPIPGKETQYFLAWKHRHGWARLHKRTPWWQPRKSRRRFNEWMRAIRRTHEFGQDRIVVSD